MKKTVRILGMVCLSFCLVSGCGTSKNAGGKNAAAGNSVENVINEQINGAENEDTNTSSEQENDVTGKTNADAGDGVDYDLTQMGSDMVYATVYQMMVSPKQYEGKTFRIRGKFVVTYYEPTAKNYYYCLIQDATACCAQGMEFVWEDGSHTYPDEYPAEEAEIVVEGTFETYQEEGDDNLYCRLVNASLQVL